MPLLRCMFFIYDVEEKWHKCRRTLIKEHNIEIICIFYCAIIVNQK